MKKWLSVASLVIAGVAIAQIHSVQFRDDNQTMVLGDFTSLMLEVVDANTRSFKGSGNPAVGIFKNQGLTVKAKNISGIAKQTKPGTYELKSGELRGNVVLVLETPKGDNSSSENTTTLTCPKVSLVSGETRSTITLLGSTSIVRQSNTLKNGIREVQKLTLNGSGGTVHMAPIGSNNRKPLQIANLSGPIAFRQSVDRSGKGGTSNTVLTGTAGSVGFEESRREITAKGGLAMEGQTVATDQPTVSYTLRSSSGSVQLFPEGTATAFPILAADLDGSVQLTYKTKKKAKDGTMQPVTLTGTGAKLVYDDASRIMRLSGNVVLKGNDTVLGGTVTADEAILVLDGDHTILRIELKGSPGASELREEKP
ncbi:MAG: hypothetical protein JST40_02405 [Armatimonadetes bacterium]|nr:hypothetical protein [Armatimonadota bacterium]